MTTTTILQRNQSVIDLSAAAMSTTDSVRGRSLEQSALQATPRGSQDNDYQTTTSPNVDESMPRSGQRIFDVAPSNIVNKRRRIVVTVLIVLANLMQMVSNCVGILGGLAISKRLGVTGEHATWVAASYPLTQGTFVLMSGRLGAVYGHKNMLLAGGLWFSTCTLVNGFVNDFIPFCLVRALSGIGGSLILPNGVAMLGIMNPPGRARNLGIGFFGASAPIGGYIGGIIVGLFLQYSQVKWCFLFLGLVTAAVFLPLWALLPREVPVDEHGTIDWIGAALGTSALILFNFTWNQAPAVGWARSYEIASLMISVLLFVLFAVWESRTRHPIMPLGIFKAPSFAPLVVVVLLNFMCMGTVLWYTLSWLQNVRHWSVLQSAISWTPFLILGTFAAVLAGWLVPRLAAQWIIALGSITAAGAAILIATMPVQQTYWAQVFPAWILISFCPDLVYTAAQIFASNSVRRSEQGVAGSLIGTLNLYGASLGLGFSSTIDTEIAKNYNDRVLGYRAALYFAFGIATVALVLDALFVRRPRDEREGWQHGEDGDDDANTAGLNHDQAETSGNELRSLPQSIPPQGRASPSHT